jgi:hypothetical protein
MRITAQYIFVPETFLDTVVSAKILWTAVLFSAQDTTYPVK